MNREASLKQDVLFSQVFGIPVLWNLDVQATSIDQRGSAEVLFHPCWT